MDRPQKALDPCLDIGEVGEGPVVEPFVETLEAEKADEAIRDKAAEESRLYVRPLKEVEGPVVESRPQQDTRLSLGRGSY